MEQEYIVTLQDGVDYDSFWDEMDSVTSGLAFVPDRIVGIVNAREHNPRNTHYSLTDDEAVLLAQDPRVLAVEIPPWKRPELVIGHGVVQNSNFTKPTLSTATIAVSSTGTNVNWGLARCSYITDIYNAGTSTTSLYNYHLDGTGVDIVITDSGINPNHPEFQDQNGTSRVQQIDWYAASGITGTQSVSHYRDWNGHGTHVAGIAAGKTYGWAKNARIYSIKVSGLEGTGDAGTGIIVPDCLDVIRLWHQKKPVDPVTGYKRPTVVNASWGYTIASGYTILGGNYRGTTWTYGGAFIFPAIQNNYGIFNGWAAPGYVPSLNADLDLLAQAGVIVCTAAGNSPFKTDVSTGADYNNYISSNARAFAINSSSTYTTSTLYYCRGMSPLTTYGINVGCSNIGYLYSTGTELATSFSARGPGVDVYAPGHQIFSAASDLNSGITGDGYNVAPYYLNSSYNQASMNGTSMSSPQVAGVAALYLQANPSALINEVKQFIVNNSQKVLYTSTVTTGDDWTNGNSLFGGKGNLLYFPYASSLKIQNNATIIGASIP